MFNLNLGAESYKLSGNGLQHDELVQTAAGAAPVLQSASRAAAPANPSAVVPRCTKVSQLAPVNT